MGGLFYLIAMLAVAAPQVRVNTVDGSVISGDLQELTPQQVVLKRGEASESTKKYAGMAGDAIINLAHPQPGGKFAVMLAAGALWDKFGHATVPADEILTIVPQGIPDVTVEKPVAWIELVDGSKLTATKFIAKGNAANIALGADKVVEIPTASIHSVRFVSPNDSIAGTWPTDAGAEATGDLLAVRKKDQIDFMEGSIGNIDDDHVILKVDGESYPVNRSKVAGLVYFHKDDNKLPDPVCVIETVGGWRLKARNVRFVTESDESPTGRFEVITVSGDKFFFIPGDQISKIDFSIGKIAYLSDLDPASIQWTPYLDFGTAAPAMTDYYAPRRDEGREHQPLQLAGKKYDKGLSLYSRTAVDYRVPTGMKKFKATAGIDDSVRDIGNVRLQISADGKTLFDKPMTGKDAPVELDLDVTGAKRLSILVDYGDQFDAGDYLDLADARMLK